MNVASFDNLFRLTPELCHYGGEPAQMPSWSVGKCGFLDLRFAEDPQWNRSQLVDMDRRVPFLVQKALYWDEGLPDMPCVIIITTTGCVLQGDRFELRIRVDENARAHVTTQSATKVHMMETNYAAQVQYLEVASGGYLEYMPDPLIPHRTSRYASDTQLVVAETGVALYSEILQSGRVHHHKDERFGFDLYATTVSIRRPDAERPLFTERMAVEPHSCDISAVGVMNGFDVFGNVFLVAPREKVHAVREAMEPFVSPDLISGVSLLPDDCGLSFRVLGRTAEPVRAEIRTFWSIVRRVCTDSELPDEFLWR